MAKIHKTITISAPVDKVYNYVTAPENLPVFWPSMVEVSNIKADKTGVSSFDWVYKMGGIKFKGHSNPTEVNPNHHVTMRNDSGIPSTFNWNYEAKGATTTEITLDVDYTVPVLGKLGEPFVRRLNEHEAEIMLNNLKAHFEAEKL
ncbi:MAG: SRPBCC family protein [Myxococcales bacterium]